MIGGITRCSFVDFPGRLAAVLFVQGCNLRCPYCHNPDLVPRQASGLMSFDAIAPFLRSRRGRISGVVISGGEPTLCKDLVEVIRRVRDLGYWVKLDTNGTKPSVLDELVSQKLVDYVALDVKDLPERYDNWLGPVGLGVMVQESIAFLRQSSVDHEYRTTLTSEHHRLETLIELHQRIADDSPWYLQRANSEGTLTQRGWTPMSDAQCRGLVPALGELGVRNVRLRNTPSGERKVGSGSLTAPQSPSLESL